MKLLFAGGGTGGHLFPAVALAQRLLESDPNGEVRFVGTGKGIEAQVLPKQGLPLEFIDIEGVVGRGWGAKLSLVPKLVKSLYQCFRILKNYRPDVVVGVGGYASGPMLMAARLAGYPTLIHEQNALPGLTNKILAPWVDRVCLSFSEADRCFHSAKTMLTGNPLRGGMEECPPVREADPTLLIFGGSRGAKAINDAMVETLSGLGEFKASLKIVHQTGAEDLKRIKEEYKNAGWDSEGVVDFIDDMSSAYAEAHLVVCRAGATTIAELTACGRPSIMIPFPYATGDHQSVNARALERKGATLVLPQDELTAERLSKLISEFFKDRKLLTTTANAARALGKRGAADYILNECRLLAEKRR